MIDKLCRIKRSARAFLLLKRMRKNDLTPDECTYNTLINGFFSEGKINHARYVFNHMLRQTLVPSVATYTTMIDGYCRNRRIDKALSVLSEMQITGVLPSELTYSALLNGYCKVFVTPQNLPLLKIGLK